MEALIVPLQWLFPSVGTLIVGLRWVLQLSGTVIVGLQRVLPFVGAPVYVRRWVLSSVGAPIYAHRWVLPLVKVLSELCRRHFLPTRPPSEIFQRHFQPARVLSEILQEQHSLSGVLFARFWQHTPFQFAIYSLELRAVSPMILHSPGHRPREYIPHNDIALKAQKFYRFSLYDNRIQFFSLFDEVHITLWCIVVYICGDLNLPLRQVFDRSSI